MKMLAVGSPYPSKLLPNATELRLSGDDYEIAVGLVKPSSDEIDLVQKGSGRFWLIYEKGLIIVQYRFFCDENGKKFEGEFPFHIGPYDKNGAKCSIEETEDGKHYLFTFSLVEHGSNTIKALKVFTLSPNFLSEFKSLIKRQRAENPDSSRYVRQYSDLGYDYSMAQLRKKAVCYCNIGSDSSGGDL